MKEIIKVVTSSLMAFVLIFSICTFSVSAKEISENDNNLKYEMSNVTRATLPSAPLVGTGNKTIRNYGNIIVNLYNNPQKVQEIWVMGNINGGGANTKASFVSGSIGPTVAIDGSWHRIYKGNMNISGGTIWFSVDVEDNNRDYNIAIVCY